MTKPDERGLKYSNESNAIEPVIKDSNESNAYNSDIEINDLNDVSTNELDAMEIDRHENESTNN
eukprot:CAMPEP_0114665908 /NCGR_PEP_ID=MMETSP0191-20121206/31632_1 /TAXON_ID=126664 /ORGANISM="Sorites sp." /LENGTH=63 /DNA_ID=CAMNT_0001912229 /DNA_START=374 /DNA_END=565 /DNA_ORIENTATION=+